MKRLGKTLASWMGGLMLLVLGACDGGSPTEPEPGRLRLTVSASPTSVTAGQPVRLTFTAVNVGGEPVELVFGDSCWADLSIASGAGIVWNSLADVFCLQSVTRRSLAPNQSLVFEDLWDQSRNGNGWVGPGTYRVFGTLRDGSRRTSPDVTLTVR